MGRIFRPGRIVRDEHGNPRLDADGEPKRELRTKNYSIRVYDANHHAKDISTGSPLITVARKMLHDLESAKGKGEPIGAQVGRITFEDAAQDVENDYTTNGRRTLAHLKRRITKHLTPFFGGRRMANITTAEARAYIAARMEAGAAPAEINNETAVLRLMFSLAVDSGKLLHAPKIPRLKLNNTRKGFFERAMLDSVLEHIPAPLAFMRPLATFAYWTGWRLGEILALQVPQIDLPAGVVRAEVGTTKNDDGRQFHLRNDDGAIVLRELYDLLDAQLKSVEALKATGTITPYVFHRPDGSRVKSFNYDAWNAACAAAGYPGKRPHDFRRTAVRNLERASVARSTAMKMVGHKTEAIYRRYAIVDEQMHREAAAKLGAFATGKPATSKPATGQVRQFKRRAAGNR